MPKTPKMKKLRLGRAGRAGRAPSGKAGQKQTQKLVVQLGEKQPFTFPQQQGLTLQDLINFEATKGQRLGTREESQAVKEAVSTETKVKPNLETLGSILMKPEPVITEAGSLEALKPVMRPLAVKEPLVVKEPVAVKPNLETLGSILMKPEPVITEAGSLEALKPVMRPKPVKVTNEFLNQLSNEIDAIVKEKPKPKPVLSESSSSFELNKSKPVKVTNEFVNQLLNEIDSTVKEKPKPKPVLSEEPGSLEIMKSQMKPKPVLSEPSSSFELNKSKPVKTVEEVFNKPITSKSLFEQIAKTQSSPEAYTGLQPPEPVIEEPVIKRKYTKKASEDKETQTAVIKGGKVVKIVDKVAEAKAIAEAEAKKVARKAKKDAKAAAEEAYGLAYTLGSADAIDAGAKIGIKEGIPIGRNIQNEYVMNLTKGEFGRFPGLGVRLKPNEQNQPASSSSQVNFA